MTLFDDVERINMEPMGYNESSFHFLNRSADPISARTRALYESWFANYPSEKQSRLRRDFMARDSQQHSAACTELLVHTLLINQEYNVTVEPADVTQRGLPDFLAIYGQNEVIVEVTTARPDVGIHADWLQFKDDLNRLLRGHIRGFALSLHVSRPQQAMPRPVLSSRDVARQIIEWVGGLDYNALRNEVEASPHRTISYPSIGWHGGTRVQVMLLADEDRWLDRPIGTGPTNTVWCNNLQTLRRVIENKARHYGEISKPFVLVVNSLSWISRANDIREVLWDFNGLWRTDRSASLRNISAIMYMDRCETCYGSFPQKIPQLWINPHASRPLPLDFLHTACEKYVGLERVSNGLHLSTLLDFEALDAMVA